MEIIYIEENNTNSIIYLDSTKYYGYHFNNNCVTPINENIKDIFNIFSLSKNYTKLPDEDDCQVYLDNCTNLKHYYHNGFEDIHKLFLNNGREALQYLSNDSNNWLDVARLFAFKHKRIICTFMGLLLISNLLSNHIVKANSEQILKLVDNYQADDIHNMINASENLTEKEKDYLYNPDFINDILIYINDSYYLKYRLGMRFNNLKIKGYDQSDSKYDTTKGYYDVIMPNTLFVKDYQCFCDQEMDVIAHEYVHLWQYFGEYNLITEASAEIISNEYFTNTNINSYTFQVKLLKELMEIIGSKPIWHYNFTGDFSMIENKVRPYLTETEYQIFLNSLVYDYDKPAVNHKRYDDLKEILAILYKNIYGKDIADDEVISLIAKNDKTLVRYYFNPRYINEEYSYYYDYDASTYETITYEEAINNQLLFIFATTRVDIDNDLAFSLIEDGNYTFNRRIDYTSANIIINRMSYNASKTYISGIIDGKKYDNVDLDDLARDGIIKVEYTLVDQKVLTAEEYQNQDYPSTAELYMLHDKSTKLNDDNVQAYMPKKVYLPTIESKNLTDENQKTLTKKDD